MYSSMMLVVRLSEMSLFNMMVGNGSIKSVMIVIMNMVIVML